MPGPETPPDFAVEGKLSVKNAERGQSARFRWQTWPRHLHVEVWGALGQGRTTFTGSSRRLKVLRAGEVLDQGPAQAVMRRHLGFAVPVDVLGGWLRGEPGPDSQVLKVDEDQRPLHFLAAGWEVEFSRYKQDSPDQPGRIRAVRPPYTVTVAIRSVSQ